MISSLTNKYKLLCIGVLMALAIVLGMLALRSSKPDAPDATAAGHSSSAREVGWSISPALSKPLVAGALEDEKGTQRRQVSVEAWERQIADVIERTDVPVNEQAKRVKEAFDKLDTEDQMDGIHHGLNLLPDDRFAALYDILYDKSENSEVLDAIFSDALNRPEGIKMPILKALRKDREHPMFFESARILDVVETEEEKAPQE
jgi:hypothetical protein